MIDTSNSIQRNRQTLLFASLSTDLLRVTWTSNFVEVPYPPTTTEGKKNLRYDLMTFHQQSGRLKSAMTDLYPDSTA
jgi:hypothetical protein